MIINCWFYVCTHIGKRFQVWKYNFQKKYNFLECSNYKVNFPLNCDHNKIEGVEGLINDCNPQIFNSPVNLMYVFL